MNFHPEVMTDAQQCVLRALAPVAAKRGFYLVGGTALALHLGHRRSVDLDWFTDAPLGDALLLAQGLRDEGIDFQPGQTAPGTLYGEIEGVRISFLEYRYPLLEPLEHWPACACRLAALDDLACMKLSALAQRGAKKDFIDLYALLRRHRPLPELLALYQDKYATDDIAHLLYALTYFDDADRQPPPALLWNMDWQAVKHGIQQEVKKVAA